MHKRDASKRVRRPGMGYETSCPLLLYRWMRAAGECQRLMWTEAQDTLQFHMNFITAVSVFYLREGDHETCSELNKLRQHLREVGNVHTVIRELQTLFER